MDKILVRFNLVQQLLAAGYTLEESISCTEILVKYIFSE